jgi:hypothetical protein
MNSITATPPPVFRANDKSASLHWVAELELTELTWHALQFDIAYFPGGYTAFEPNCGQFQAELVDDSFNQAG